MVFWGHRFPPKNERTNSTYYYDNSGRLVFVRFLEEIDDPKNRFEIKWPLGIFNDLSMYLTYGNSERMVFKSTLQPYALVTDFNFYKYQALHSR